MASIQPARAARLLLGHPVARALAVASQGVPSHLVGGALRDRLLAIPSRDFDGVVARDGEEIAERLAARLAARLVRLGGKAFASYRLVAPGFELDLWDREGQPLTRDLERRDFTVNAFALDLETGELVDPFGGVADTARRVLRAVTPKSFTGDPLRVLRLARLAVQLPGFAADPPTVRLAHEAARLVERVASERVREELRLILDHPEAHQGVALLAAMDLYPGLWLGRPGIPGPAGRAILELELLAPAAHRVLSGAADLDPGIRPRPDFSAARLALTFASLPVERGDGARPRLRRFLEAGYLTRSQMERTALFLAWPELPRGERELTWFLHRCGPLWGAAAAFLGARAAAAGETEAWAAGLERLLDLARRRGATILRPPQLLTGGDVQELLGTGPGPVVGRALAAVREAQVEGRVDSPTGARELLRSLADGGELTSR